MGKRQGGPPHPSESRPWCLPLSRLFLTACLPPRPADFRCARCGPNMSLTADGRCVWDGTAGASGCPAALPYRAYCSRCAQDGRCTQCTPGRSAQNGACSLPCQQLFGKACIECTRAACLRVA